MRRCVTAVVDQLRNLSSHEEAYGLKSKYEVNCISRSGCLEDPANVDTTFENLRLNFHVSLVELVKIKLKGVRS